MTNNNSVYKVPLQKYNIIDLFFIKLNFSPHSRLRKRGATSLILSIVLLKKYCDKAK